MSPRIVLASSSRYRADVLRDAGRSVTVVTPAFDEDGARHLFAELGAEAYAVELATRKARSVLEESGDHDLVVGADQVGVRREDGSDVEIGKPTSLDDAVRQLMAVAGRSFRLVNGIAVIRVRDRAEFTAVDVHDVHMARYGLDRSRRYVEEYRPLDCVGGCRIEDPSGLVVGVDGSGPDGVMGMPLGVLDRLVARACPR